MKKQAHRSSVKLKPVLILPAFVFLAFILSSHQVAVSKSTQAPHKIGSPLLVAENPAKASFLAGAAEHFSQRTKRADFLVSAQRVTSLTTEPAKMSAFYQQLPVSTQIAAAAPDYTRIQKDTIPRKNLAGEVFTVVEQPPLFPGGLAKLYEFLGANMEYPAAAKSAGLEGLIITQFIITKEGKITEVKLLKKLSPEMDTEAIRVIALMPDWLPGQQNGQPVNVRYTLPVRFSLKATFPQETAHSTAALSPVDSVFAIEKVQQNPEYPGGLKEMYKFLAENVRSPREDPTAVRPNAFAQGAVIVQFIITKKGEVKDINVVKSLSPRADAEVKRVIASMPRWTPGKLNGEVVNVRYTLPVRFSSH